MATDETLNDAWGALPEEVRYKLAVARCGTRKEDRHRAINDAVLGMSAALAAAEARGVAQGGDLLERAWLVIANAHGGDWSRATPEWREAATAWRDAWHRGCCTPALIPFGDVCEDCPHRTTPPATGATEGAPDA